MNGSDINHRQEDILIVDDTPENLRLLSTMLSKRGYNVRKAINGPMALSAVKAMPPSLILLDIHMPEMDGYQVCEQLKKDAETRAIPVIFLSALHEVQYKVKAFQVGGVDYISKPFQLEEVLARIQNQLTIQNLQAQLQAQNAQLEQALGDLKIAQTELVQKEKMVSLGQLAAGMAHEINNPISFISGNLSHARNYTQDLLNLIYIYQQEYPNPTLPIKEILQKIDLNFIASDLQRLLVSMQTGVERISSIILALRIFSRLNESAIKAVDIHEGIDSTLLLLHDRLKEEGNRPEIQVIKNYGDLPLITCYPSQMNQVFINVLNNAIDAFEMESEQAAFPSPNPTIWITTELTNSETVIIRIKDNGVGIPEEVQSRLYDPFFTTKPVGKGRGLGLSMSYQIVVEKHKGKLTFHSSLGAGTEFAIAIPVYLGKG